MRVSAFLLATLFLVSACTTGGGRDALIDRDWTLSWVEGFETMPSGVAAATVRFSSDGRLSGNTGCNSASGSYTTQGDGLTIGPLITTKRACVEERGNQLEGAYVRAIEAARRFAIDGGELQLLDDAGRVVARFR